uniref:Transmembrane protein n=1 Tax=Medicago truncatula TaxID=3880 RepID=B7FG14_MEDTR|nr:unknown [Medicago truncatula]
MDNLDYKSLIPIKLYILTLTFSLDGTMILSMLC